MLLLETTTKAMQHVARAIFDNLDAGYYLAGGTALALRIGHRKSVDLDYFINSQIDTTSLKEKLVEVFSQTAVEILFEKKNTLWCAINGVKVSFMTRADTLLASIDPIDYFRLANIGDITVMKLNAICGREEYKDYFDLACIAEQTDVRSWVIWWQKIYPRQDFTSWVVALSTIDSVLVIPLEILKNFKDKNVSGILKHSVQEISRQIQTIENSE